MSTIFEGTFDDLDYFVDHEEYRDFDISFISVDCQNKKVELIIDSSGCYKGGEPTMRVKGGVDKYMMTLITYFNDIKNANCYVDFQFEIYLGDKVLKIGNIDDVLEFSKSKEFDDFDISKICINYDRHVVELTISYFSKDNKTEKR